MLALLGGPIVRTRSWTFAAVVSLSVSINLIAQTANSSRYELPPKEIIAAFDAPPLPQGMLSPSRQNLALLYRRPYPTIAELCRPMLRLAGQRINPNTNGPHLTARIFGITIKRIADGVETKVTVPSQPNISNVRFSPDGSR